MANAYLVRSKHLYDYAYHEQSQYPDAIFDELEDAIRFATQKGESDERRDWAVWGEPEHEFIGAFCDGCWRYVRGEISTPLD